jgi:hypothetical protein
MAINHQNNFATNLTSGVTAGDTTSPLNSIPTIDAPFYLAFDALNINGNYEVVYITSKTATNVNHAALAHNHTTAEEVRCVCPATEMDTWSAALDTTTWSSYTPTPTNFVKGAGGILEGFYTQIGKTVFGKVHFKYGAGSSVSGAIIFSLPVECKSVANNHQIGDASFLDAATQIYFGTTTYATTTTASVNPYQVAGTYQITVPSSETVPFTFGTDDEFWSEFYYEAA